MDPTGGPQITVGNAVGQKLPGSLLPIITGEAITSETFDPTSTGKITVINFWGTWCGPCVKELPDFDKIAKEFDVEIAHHLKVGDIIRPYRNNLDGCGYIIATAESVAAAKEKAIKTLSQIDSSILRS